MFSPFYAWLIRWIGLASAARLLTIIFTAWLIAAAWKLAAGLTSISDCLVGRGFSRNRSGRLRRRRRVSDIRFFFDGSLACGSAGDYRIGLLFPRDEGTGRGG